MDETVYKYDYETQDWIVSEDEWFNNADMEDIPFVFELNCDPMADDYNESVLLKSAWDTVKRTYIPYSELKEYNYSKVGYLYMNVKGEKFIFSEKHYDFYARYKVKKEQYTNNVCVLADKISVKFVKYQNGYCPLITRNFVVSWYIDVINKKDYLNPKYYLKDYIRYYNNFDDIWDAAWKEIGGVNYKCNNFFVPPIVADDVLELLKNELVPYLGYKPSTLGFNHTVRDIYAFIFKPLDYRIALFYNFIGSKFYYLFSDNENNNFNILCEYLNIKPSKGLRKAYSLKYSSIIVYYVMRYLGFKDYNAISKMYYVDNILNIDLSDVVSDREWFDLHLSYLKEYTKWCIVKKGEMWAVKRLKTIEYDEYLEDILRIFSSYKEVLFDKLQEEFLKRAFNKKSHDFFVKEVNKIDAVQGTGSRIEYDESDLMLECIINGYEFALVHDENEFADIGRALHNCISGYKSDVLKKYCRIITISKDGKYVAGIELIKGNLVHQALSYCNHILEGELRLVFGKWKEIKGLAISENLWGCSYDWLNNIDLSNKDFIIEARPYQKTIGEMSWQELLEFDDKNLSVKYYRVLGEKLNKEKGFPNVTAPKWKIFKNELEYLEYHFPEGYRIYEAAYKGIHEAQEILGNMYLEGCHIPENKLYGEYWKVLSMGVSIDNAKKILDGRYTKNEKSLQYLKLIDKIKMISPEYGKEAYQRLSDKIFA